ncbi:MAG: four helix bundle protein [Nitrospirae bacterium]|nr:MAG: four helix bundle protein [Nitrospirota bacterium]
MATLARTFPKEEKYRLTDQVIRASRSVTANLAEGYGRFHYSESIQFARHARGSLYELLDHLTVARDEGIVNAEKFQQMRAEVGRAIAVVNGYIRHAKAVKVLPPKPRITNNE